MRGRCSNTSELTFPCITNLQMTSGYIGEMTKKMNNTGCQGACRQWRSQVGDSCIGQLPHIWPRQLIINLQTLESFSECLFVAQIWRLLWDNCGFAPGTITHQLTLPYSGTQAREADPHYNVTEGLLEPNICHFHSYSRMR